MQPVHYMGQRTEETLATDEKQAAPQTKRRRKIRAGLDYEYAVGISE